MTITELSPSRTQVTAQIEVITPVLAQRWLDETNLNNRKLRSTKVAALAADLKNGLWKMTPDAIAFDDQGILINGQHRLAAIAKSGVPADALVVYGMPSSTFIVTDDGLKRTFADVLGMRNVPQASLVASVVGLVYRWEATGNPDGYIVGNPVRNGSKQQLLERYDLAPEAFHASSLAGVRIHKRLGLSAAWWAAVMFRFAEKSQADAAFFEHALTTGLDYEGRSLPTNSPLRVLRETILADAVKNRPFFRTNRRATIAIITKAWNSYRLGDEISILKFRAGGAKPEAYPEII